MNSKLTLINVLRFVILVFAQIFIFNKINLGGSINPMIYPLFIILLPFETNKNLSLVYGFLLGLSIDLFSGSIGLHTSATVFMAFIRPLIFSLLKSNKAFENGILPGINDLGSIWFVSYTALLVLAHHIFFFFIEAFSFDEFGHTSIKLLFSSATSIMLIIFIDILFKSQKQR